MATRNSVSVRRLESPSELEINRVVSVLSAAFGKDDPFTRFLVGGDVSLIPMKFAANVRAAAVGGEIHVAAIGPESEDIVGVGVWFGPGQYLFRTEEQRTAGWNQFLAMLPTEVRSWWVDNFLPTMLRLGDDSLGPGFKLNQWHLLLFAVDPDHQRKGFGKALMAFGEKLAKASGASVILETTTDIDVAIYKRLGFEIKGKTTIASPLGTSPIYQMMKTP